MSTALDRGLDVLEILAHRGEVKVAELVTELGVSRATAFRIMVTLETRGFVEHVPERHIWRLGRTIADLGATIHTGEIVQVAESALADLHATTGETVNLATVHRNRVTWAATIESSFSLRMLTTIGDGVAMHATALGKAILSATPESEWLRMLPPAPFPSLTGRTITTMAELRTDIALVRERGWALDNEECELSGVCVAAPIIGRAGRPVAGISISSVVGRLPVADQVILGREVMKWCDQISESLGAGRRAPAEENGDTLRVLTAEPQTPDSLG